MSYLTQKLKVEGKLKKIKIIATGIIVAMLLGLAIFSRFVPPKTWKYYLATPEIAERGEGELRLHFLNVGQGDSTLIELPDGKIMLIDGGNNTAAAEKNIMRYLNALKIDTIDYLLVTHADSDHCGAMDVVLENKEIKNAFIPNANPTVNTEYAEFYTALQKENCSVKLSSRSVLLSQEGKYAYTLSFLYPYTIDVEEGAEKSEENNDSSAVVWLDYQGVSALFTGDAPLETESLLLRDDELGVLKNYHVELSSTEILKVAHHGSKYSTSAEFLQYLNIETAIISSGKGNTYGHPTQEVLDRLQAVNAEIHRTDMQGNIMITVSQDGTYKTKFI